MVHTINNLAEFKDAISRSPNLVVVDFFATWCGPCKRIAPVLEELASSLAGQVDFYSVDVDIAEDVAADQGISAMPTFFYFKGGKKVDELVGASTDQLKALINKNK